MAERVEVPQREVMLDLKSPPTPLAGDYLPRGTPLTNLSMLFSGQSGVLGSISDGCGFLYTGTQMHSAV